jgi:hypothetical protein
MAGRSGQAQAPPKLGAVALANKMACITWKMMVSGQGYTETSDLLIEVGAA